MRTLSFLILLATAAAPALAARDNDRGGRNHRSEPVERRENVSPGGDEAQQTQSEPRQFEARRSERNRGSEQGATEPRRQRFIQRGSQEISAGPAGVEGSQSSSNSLRPRERRIRTIPDIQPTEALPAGSDRSRSFEGRHRRDYQDGNYKRWSTSTWRANSHYDWRRYRDRNRSLFRLGFYYDPFGWSYRRWSAGSYLYPSYYGSRFWLNDPGHYRLPPAYGPYRWVRYWNDALLVNVYTGQVVDVLHNFFW
jgi:Ni/Co efflux regulator RcnB